MKNMTKQSRSLIYLGLFLSGAVILSMIIYAVGASKNGEPLNGGVFATIIIIAVLSAALVYVWRARRKTNVKLLNREFFEAYEKISDSMEGSVLSRMEIKETLSDIMGLFLDAQNSGKSVTQVTGDDLGVFIEQVKNSFGYRNRFLFTLLTGVQYSIMYIFMVQGFIWMEYSRSMNFFEAQPDYSVMVFLLPLAFIGVPLIRVFIRKQKIVWAVAVILGIFGLNVAIMEITEAYFMDVEIIRIMHEETISYVPGWGFLILWIGIFAATIGAKWFKRRRSSKSL